MREAAEKSVYETMLEIEADMHTRIRANGQNDDLKTSEMLWCSFIHETARPVNDGAIPDMHSHVHNFCLNLSYEPNEKRFKAAQFFYIKKDMPYYQAH